ncbi:MAG: hypothetical protein Q4A27_00490 [bacterium]|nr:hypothetical protein [bacterium]
MAQNFTAYRAVIAPVVFKWGDFTERNRLLIYDAESGSLVAEVAQSYYPEEDCGVVSFDFFSAEFEEAYYACSEENDENGDEFNVEDFLLKHFNVKPVFEEKNNHFKFEYA